MTMRYLMLTARTLGQSEAGLGCGHGKPAHSHALLTRSFSLEILRCHPQPPLHPRSASRIIPERKFPAPRALLPLAIALHLPRSLSLRADGAFNTLCYVQVLRLRM